MITEKSSAKMKEKKGVDARIYAKKSQNVLYRT